MQGEGYQYQPSAEVLEHLKQVDFVAVVGPTAAGKSTLITAVKNRDTRIHEVMNNTSRAPRPDEQDGVDFQFKSRSEMMNAMQSHQYAQVMLHPSGDMYATEGNAYSAEGIALLPVLAAVIPSFRGLPFKRMRIVYILPPDWNTWMARIAAHDFTPEQRLKRLDEARQSLTFAVNDPQVFFVVNDDLEQATMQFMDLIMRDAVHATDQVNARILASALLRQLEE